MAANVDTARKVLAMSLALGLAAMPLPLWAQDSGEAGEKAEEQGPGIEIPLIGRVGVPGFMAGWFGKGEEEGKSAPNGQGEGGETPAVIVATVATQSVGDRFDFIGTIQPIERVGVRARVEGYIQDVAFSGGQRVRRGDLLFQIEPAQYEARVRSAEAQLSGAEATRNQAQRNFSRQQQLVQGGVTAQATLEDATANLENAEAQLLQAQATLTQAQLDLSYTRIEAAIDGEMSAPLITRGNYVSATSGDLATLTQMTPIWGVFPIAEGQLVTWQRVGPGQSDETPVAEAPPNGQTESASAEAEGGEGGEMQAASDMTSSIETEGETRIASAEGTGAAGAPPLPEGAQQVSVGDSANEGELGTRYRLQLRLPNGALYEPPGRFDFVGNTVNSTTGTVEARIRFPNEGDFLLANQSVTLVATEAEPPVLPVVPQAAIQFSREGRAVLVVKPNDTVERRAIEVGETIGNMSAVTNGLQGGETIVLRGSANVEEGTKVRPLTEEQAQAEAQARQQNRPGGGGEGQGNTGSQGNEGGNSGAQQENRQGSGDPGGTPGEGGGSSGGGGSGSR